MLDFKMHIFIVFLLFIFSFGICHADSIYNEQMGWQCSDPDVDSLPEGSLKTNRDNLLNLLTENGPIHNGFFKTSVGKSSEEKKFYGLVQCRADVSAENCGNCTREAVAVALHECKKSKDVTVWFTWCLLRYSTQDFFGVWENSSSATASDVDNSSIVLNGSSFMSEVATKAANKYLMFHAGVLDLGQSGKRYGMAQCRRDISTSNCGKCFDEKLETYDSIIRDKRNWEVYGSSCSMWYHDYLFYFNISNIPATANNGARRFKKYGVAVGITMAVLVLLIVP